jgi:hypothetical protein
VFEELHTIINLLKDEMLTLFECSAYHTFLFSFRLHACGFYLLSECLFPHGMNERRENLNRQLEIENPVKIIDMKI